MDCTEYCNLIIKKLEDSCPINTYIPIEEMQIRIIRLEETIQDLLDLKYKLDELLKSAEESANTSIKVISLMNEVRMDIAAALLNK